MKISQIALIVVAALTSLPAAAWETYTATNGWVNITMDVDYDQRAPIEGFIYKNTIGIFSYHPAVRGGNGTEENPFRIEDWSIDAAGKPSCIAVRDTTKHFVVRDLNCTNATLTSDGGILISGIESGTGRIGDTGSGNIVHVTRSTFGIRVYRSDEVTVQNVWLAGNQYGLGAYYSDDLEITENWVAVNQKYGVYLYDCRYASITDSTIQGNGSIGVYVTNNSAACNVRGNDIFENYLGIRIRSSWKPVIQYNDIHHNDVYGIQLLYGVEDGYVTYNNIEYNGSYAVRLYHSSGSGSPKDNKITSNNIIANNVNYPLRDSQAYDNSPYLNEWGWWGCYPGFACGNHWSDGGSPGWASCTEWVVGSCGKHVCTDPGYYPIDGGRGRKDCGILLWWEWDWPACH